MSVEVYKISVARDEQAVTRLVKTILAAGGNIAFVDAKEDSYWLRLKTEIGSYDRDQYLANLTREVGLRLVERATDSLDVVAERPVSFWRRRIGDRLQSTSQA